MNALSRAQRAYDNAQPAPMQTPYERWCEAYLVEVLKSDEINTATCVIETIPEQFDAFVHLLAERVPTFWPLALNDFRQKVGGLTGKALQARLDDGEIDALETVRLALLAPVEARRTWPVIVWAAADALHDAIIAAAPCWAWVRAIYDEGAGI